MEQEPLIYLEKATKKYRLYKKNTHRLLDILSITGPREKQDFYAVKDFDLTVFKGDIVGILGKNGSGKSTLLKMVAGITTPTSGMVRTKGKIVPLLELGAGFHPDLTGWENIYFYTTLMGYRRSEINQVIDEVIDFSELGDFIHQPLRTYSSGMKSRLGFSVSTFINPDILIVDEVLAVGDQAFKEKSKSKLLELFRQNKTILFVSHSINDIKDLCNKAIFMHKGKLIKQGESIEIIAYYQDYLQGKIDI